MADVSHGRVSFAAGGIFAFCVVAVSACGGGSSTTPDAKPTMGTPDATPVDTPPMVTPDAPPTDAPPLPPPSTPRTVFVTSAVYQGGYLGGLDGADAECRKLAVAAGLTGTFKAWLSSSTRSAADRLTHGTAAYMLVDGTRVADSWVDLVHADLQHPIDIDEHGTPLPAPDDPMIGGTVWSATQFDGMSFNDPSLGGMNCNGWTDPHASGMTGDRTKTDEQWSVRVGLPCTSKGGLYCFEQ